jgi:hypothetical protein
MLGTHSEKKSLIYGGAQLGRLSMPLSVNPPSK